jgi:peroxiredoxin
MGTRAACLVLIAALGWTWACRGSDGRGDGSPNPAVGRELDAFAFPDLAGRQIAWSAEHGLRDGSGEVQKPDALVIHAFQPDCPACRQQARELERLRARDSGRTAILGVAYRLAARDLRAFSDDTDVTYPLLMGTGSLWAESWGRGDSMYIVDRRGRISYAQVGIHPSDAERWQAVLEDLAADRVARYSGPERSGLDVGEGLPVIELPLVNGQGFARLGLDEQGTLVAEQSGERRRFRAAIGFFSRY